MKIAVASEGKMVAEHFGHCEGFTLFDVQDQHITGKQFIPNPGHRPGFLPVFLHEKGVNIIISGGMGGGAFDICSEKGVKVVTGASGDAEAAASLYLQGKLKSTGAVCHKHEHADECGK